MLHPRIIPCLLIHQGELVKTRRFSEPQYVGDPLNAVRIFNEKEVDELIVVDIDASVTGREPDFKLISNLAAECRMPLCYGGGVKSPEQVEKIVGLGVEKVAIGHAAISNPQLIKDAAQRVGTQSIVVVMDIKKIGFPFSKYTVLTQNGRKVTNLSAVTFAKQSQDLGAGEILINSIDRDGTLAGYDFELVDQIRQAISIPMTVLGGAKDHGDISSLISRYGIIGAAAGSMFVFKGKYRAVLIQYPTRKEKEDIMIKANFNYLPG
ncbi:MAG: AglZ/HisF2 family acetamidino modification protein [Synechococcales cyanobacterium]